MRTIVTRFRRKWLLVATALCVAAMLALSTSNLRAAMSESDVPETSIVPADSGSASPAAPAASPAAPAAAGMTAAPAAPATHPRVVHHATVAHFEVEPAQTRLRVIRTDWVYSSPTKASKHLEQLQVGKFINVSGSTHYFLRVNLKNGETGYVEPEAVELVTPTDKIFMLNHNAGVLDKPNKWGKKLSEVHQGHHVHVVGLSLSYARIRMKSGLEGYIPLTAME
jgi:hypothetical protein